MIDKGQYVMFNLKQMAFVHEPSAPNASYVSILILICDKMSVLNMILS